MRIVSQPLQPYEHDLIRALGCTTDEYKEFVLKAQRRVVKPRPAAYDGIPDIQAPFLGLSATALFFINLAVGVALTAVSYLLAPKPQAPKAGGRSPTSKTLESVTGRARFNETFGFESNVSLAEFGTPIAIVFGRWTGSTGGIVASPALVWSRMLTFGNEEGIKVLFVVGEQGLKPPELEGIFLGNQPLNGVFKQQFAFYWRSEEGDNRIKARHLVYGTRGQPASGDPKRDDDVFTVPTLGGSVETGFCGAYTPTSNAEFGGYGALRNGTAYRLNWRVVPYLDTSEDTGKEDDPQDRMKDERKKISGAEANKPGDGQKGEGRGYSCRIGLFRFNGRTYDKPEDVSVRIGDELEYKVNEGSFSDSAYSRRSGVNNDDVDDVVDNLRIEADEALQAGEIFICGGVVMQCTKRSSGNVWQVGASSVTYRLKVIDIIGNFSSIKLSGRNPLERDFTYEGGEYDPDKWVGTSNYPLMKVSFGIVRNTRAVDITEIGITATVWNQAQGLCNFRQIPSPPVLNRADNDQIAITTGTITSYMKRTSAFMVQIRPSGSTGAWATIPDIFAVTSGTPSARRIWMQLMPYSRGRYEYRFTPLPGAVLARLGDDEVIEVDAKSSKLIKRYTNGLPGVDGIVITVPGSTRKASELLLLKEMVNRGQNVNKPSGPKPDPDSGWEWVGQ